MNTATHNDIVRLFPGIQDHTVVDVLAAEATVGELEATLRMLEDNDENLIEVKQEKGDRLNRLLGILANAQITPQDEIDR